MRPISWEGGDGSAQRVHRLPCYDMFCLRRNEKAYMAIILNDILTLKDFSRSQSHVHTKVAICRKQCKIDSDIATIQTANRT